MVKIYCLPSLMGELSQNSGARMRVSVGTYVFIHVCPFMKCTCVCTWVCCLHLFPASMGGILYKAPKMKLVPGTESLEPVLGGRP